MANRAPHGSFVQIVQVSHSLDPSRFVCSVLHCNDQHSSLHILPTKRGLINKWMDFINEGRDVPLTERDKPIFVCAHHFSSDCFLNSESGPSYAAGSVNRLSIDDASIPTIRPVSTSSSQQGNTQDQCSSPPLILKVEDVCSQKTHTCKKYHTWGTRKLCPECGISFYSHKTHTCKTYYSCKCKLCPKCGMSIYRKTHACTKYSKLKLCPECGAFFRNQDAHTCEYKKPYSCNVCGKRFASTHWLKDHSKLHEDGYKHVCKYCFASFRTRPDKLVHEQSHQHLEKPYQCPDCPQVFAKIRERRKHLLSHRGPKTHICHICSMDFPNNSHLERHMAVHTKAKQFVCEVCQRSFTQPSHLKSHMRVHTGEKPYQCQHCDKSFNHNVSLKSHTQRYHGQVPDPGKKVLLEKTSRNEPGAEKDETQEMESVAVDAKGTEQSKDNAVNSEHGGEEKVGKTRKSTGRPRGGPKKNADDANQSKRQQCIRDENEAGQGNSDSADEEYDSDSDFDPAEQRSKDKRRR